MDLLAAVVGRRCGNPDSSRVGIQEKDSEIVTVKSGRKCRYVVAVHSGGKYPDPVADNITRENCHFFRRFFHAGI